LNKPIRGLRSSTQAMPYSRPGMAMVNGTTAYAKFFMGMSVRSTMKAKNTPMIIEKAVEPRAKITVLTMTAHVVGLVHACRK
jgi:hypothetical protein